MLDPAQEFVGRGELVARLNRDPVACGKNLERFERRAHPQFGMPSTRNQLLGLCEEFDFANAATADLDVMAFNGDFVLAAEGLHLPLHVMHVGKRREVQMLAPHERGDFGEQSLAGLQIAGTWQRLDHRRAFPCAAFALIIVQRCRDRDSDRRRSWIGPQPQVDTEDIAIDGA